MSSKKNLKLNKMTLSKYMYNSTVQELKNGELWNYVVKIGFNINMLTIVIFKIEKKSSIRFENWIWH